MKIGVISDTHEHIENIRKAVLVLNERKVATVIHLGDYCAGPSARALNGINATLIGILGNNDGDVGSLQRSLSASKGTLITRDCMVLEEDGARIVCYHGTVPEITEALITCGTYDIVLYGHTHVLDFRKAGKTLAVNPGSVHGFGERATIAIVDTESKTVEHIDL